MEAGSDSVKPKWWQRLREIPKQSRFACFNVAAILVVLVYLGTSILQGLKTGVSTPTPQLRTAEEYYALGLEAYEQEDYTQAIEHFNNAIYDAIGVRITSLPADRKKIKATLNKIRT